MCRPLEHCCGSLHASSSAECFRNDSGSCSPTRSGRMVTGVAMTSGSNPEISRDQLAKDAFSRRKERLNYAVLEICNTSLTWSVSTLHAHSAHCSRRLPWLRQQELIREAALNSQPYNATAQNHDANAHSSTASRLITRLSIWAVQSNEVQVA
jgi:hypothetical protein